MESFFLENIGSRITSKISDEILVVYTDYQNNYTGKYTAIIGYGVNSLEDIPHGFVGREFEKQIFKKYLIQGKLPDALMKTWQDIWKNDKELNRSYQYDLEIYGKESQDKENSEATILLGIEK